MTGGQTARAAGGIAVEPAMEPLERVAVVMTLMRQLQDALQHETRCLREMRLARLDETRTLKTLLGDAYEIEVQALRRSPEILGSLPQGIRDALETETRQLQLVRRTNTHALRAAHAAVESLARHLGESLACASFAAGACGSAAGAGGPTGRVIWGAFARRGSTARG